MVASTSAGLSWIFKVLKMWYHVELGPWSSTISNGSWVWVRHASGAEQATDRRTNTSCTIVRLTMGS